MTVRQRYDDLRQHPGVIVTPGATAARLLSAELDLAEAQSGRRAWHTQAVTPWPVWLEQRFEQGAFAHVSSPAGTAEFVLSPDQEQVLWERVTAGAGEMAIPAPEFLARVAMKAWQTANLWRLALRDVGAAPYADDARMFMAWVEAFVAERDRLGAIDSVSLLCAAAAPASVGGHDAALAHGFLAPAPALREALQAGVDGPVDTTRRAQRCHAFSELEGELHAAAAWALATAEADADARVVIAVDKLVQQRETVWRCLDDVFAPASPLVAASRLTTPVNCAAERQLESAPLIRHALTVLELGAVVQAGHLTRFITSPYVGGASSERGERALLDLELRRLERHEIPLQFVVDYLGRSSCPDLAHRARDLHTRWRALPRRQAVARWVADFGQLLSIAGWPGEAPLDAYEMHYLAQWGESCDRLGRLQAVVGDIDRSTALQWLRRLLKTPARGPRPVSARIFVATSEQALVLSPSHLWLAGCDSQAFFGDTRPTPLLPFAAQHAAGVPGANAAQDLLRARSLLSTLTADPREVVASYCRFDGDMELRASPLVPGLAEVAVADTQPYVPLSWRQARVGVSFSDILDEHGPPLASGSQVPGGAGLFAAQSACPFRAFAKYRLRARALEEPEPGITARRKGILVHRALAKVWSQLETQAGLLALRGPELEALVARCVAEVVPPLPLETRTEHEIRQIERERLQRLLMVWLELEAHRDAFEVVAIEQGETVDFAQLRLSFRLDRRDRLAGGREIIIDYKTGYCRKKEWQVPRPDQPQLPLYALTWAGGATSGICYAAVDAQTPKLLQEPTDLEDEALWETATEAWRDALEQLATEIRSGLARVDPKLGRTSCRNCDLPTLCRIGERETPDPPKDDDAG